MARGLDRMFGSSFETTTIQTRNVSIYLRHGGGGPPLLLLHGYPQTHAMWHKVAPALAKDFYVVCPDLRGYGDSGKPPAGPRSAQYSKREMASDMVEVMAELGFDRFCVAGHDRGGRVTHRLTLDHPEKVERACVMDICPTLYMFRHTDQALATGYYHWFFLIQGGGLPERMIGADPEFYLRKKMGHWSAPDAMFDDDAMAEYIRCFSNPETIRASCDDYRAAAGIDLEHDDADAARRIECPLLVLWGEQGFVNRNYDVIGIWRQHAAHVRGRALRCGHFLAEERPREVIDELTRFFTPSEG